MKLLRKKLSKAQCCGGNRRRMRPSCRHNHSSGVVGEGSGGPTSASQMRRHQHSQHHRHHFGESALSSAIVHRTRRHGRRPTPHRANIAGGASNPGKPGSSAYAAELESAASKLIENECEQSGAVGDGGENNSINEKQLAEMRLN